MEPNGHVARSLSRVVLTEHVSLSRIRRRAQCRRMDWWQTEGSRDGFRRSAPADAQLAYALKKLTSWPAVIGDAVHHAAALRARAVRDGLRPPDYEELLDHVRARLNRAVLSRSIDAFHARPSEVVMLREVYFREWPEGRIPVDVVAATKVRVTALMRRMLAHPVWEDLARCRGGEILICDSLDALVTEADGTPVKIYAAPDLVWVSNEPVLVPAFGVPLLPPVIILLDWKTGRAGSRVDATRDQLALYAWWVSQKLPLPVTPSGYVGRVADLSAASDEDQDIQFVLRPHDIARGRRMIEHELAAILGSRSPDGAVPMDAAPRNVDACRWCPFTPLCTDRPA